MTYLELLPANNHASCHCCSTDDGTGYHGIQNSGLPRPLDFISYLFHMDLNTDLTIVYDCSRCGSHDPHNRWQISSRISGEDLRRGIDVILLQLGFILVIFDTHVTSLIMV